MMRSPTFTLGGLVFALMFFVAAAMPGDARAQDLATWRVLETAGDVTITQQGAGIVNASVDATVSERSIVRTGASGRIILTRGENSIVIGPNTELNIPEQDTSWGTRIIQSIGTALFKVEKKLAPHFEVVTPYLAAVVKGTSFTVNVRDGSGLVHVVEGAVQVTDGATGANVVVRPGQTARTSAGGGLQLDNVPVDNGATTDSASGSDSESSTATAETQTAAVTETAATTATTQSTSQQSATTTDTSSSTSSASSQGIGRGLTLSTPVGLTKIDVAKATNGLVRSASAPGQQKKSNGSSRAANGVANGLASANGASVSRPPVAEARVNDRSATAQSSSRAATRIALAGNNGNGKGNSGNAGGNSGNNGNGNGNSGNNGNAGGNSGNNGNGNGNSGNNGNAGGNSGNNGNGNGNSGNNGNAGGNSGNNGNAGGNSGSSGNGNGNSGNNGNAGGNSGNSGNAGGDSGNSGNAGGNSGNSGNGNGNSGNNGNGKNS